MADSIYPSLRAIDWSGLVGGDKDATSAISARDRKLAFAAELTKTVLPLADHLKACEATFQATTEILGSEPYAARWYLDLAGLTSKTVAQLKPRYSAAGLSRSPETIAANRERGKAILSETLEAFCRWINSMLVELYPVEGRSPELALATVLAMMGARIDGRVRNMAGDDAVLVLKTLLVGEFSSRGIEIEVRSNTGAWEPYSPSSNLLKQKTIRFGGRMTCEFIPGGNRPDLKIMLDGLLILHGEVKGRSDLSNMWESWVPQIIGHLQTWAAEAPLVPRVFFGTIVTSEMIEGVTAGGTRHTGLRALAKSGILSAAYNLTNTVEGEAPALAAFHDLVDELAKRMEA